MASSEGPPECTSHRPLEGNKDNNMEDEGYCISCKHAPGFNDDGTAECRRHAPLPRVLHRADVVEASERVTEWPLVTKNDFCGDWEAAI